MNMKGRYSNLELLRIISMCGIIIMHYFGMGGAVQNAVFPNFSWLFNHGMSAFCISLVNCFVLITGYFLVEKNSFSFRKPIELLIITGFYGLVACVFASTAFGVKLSPPDVLYAVFPFFNGKRWFVETYIILILFAPFLNKLLLSLRKEHFQLLLAIQLVIFSLWYSVGLSAPVLDNGYGILNFITLYLIGGYIRLFGSGSRFAELAKGKYLAIYVGCSVTTFAASYFINPYGYAFITNIVGAAAIFLFFLKLNLGVNPKINKISGAAFDVYFIHSDSLTSKPLMYNLLLTKLVVDSPWMILHMLAVIPVIWLLGTLTCALRKKLFSVSVDHWLDKIPFINKTFEI